MIFHIVSCLWVFVARISDDPEHDSITWISGDLSDPDKTSSTKLYLTSLYFIVTTITTVGYGDIYPTKINHFELGFGIVLMIGGVIIFSLAQASLTSILSTYDATNAKYQEKVNILNQIYKDYFLPLELYSKLK